MIEFLVILIFSWIFFSKLWKRLFSGLFWFFKWRNVSESYSIIGRIFYGIFRGIKWTVKGLWWLIRQTIPWVIKGFINVLDYLKMKIWN